MCFVLPESTAGEVFFFFFSFLVSAASHFHTNSIPEINPQVLVFFCVFPKQLSKTKPRKKKKKKEKKDPFAQTPLPKLPTFSTRRHLIQHPTFPRLPCPGVQWVTRCSWISWRTVCKRQPWRARSGDTVWWRDRASGPYTPALWAELAAAEPDRRCPAEEEKTDQYLTGERRDGFPRFWLLQLFTCFSG